MSKSSSKVTNLPKNLVKDFSKVFTQNKGYVELFIVTLLLLQYMPQRVFYVDAIDSQINNVRGAIQNTVTPFLQHPLTVLVLFVLAIYSYYVQKDMIFFLILLITFIARKQ